MKLVDLEKRDNLLCPYCMDKTVLVGGDVIYPHRPDLYKKWFYSCRPCGAYVGCHPGTKKPLGRLANGELRKAKQEAHAAFDPLWKSGRRKRKDAYAWLAANIGIDVNDCHIGEFDVKACKLVVAACRVNPKYADGNV